jgi:hypothetical protein
VRTVPSTHDLLLSTQRSVDRLAGDVRRLRAAVTEQRADALRHALRRRGLTWKKALHDGCLVPRTRRAQEEFYQLLRHYSFRLFLRDVIRRRDDFRLADLVRYCSASAARRYLQWLRMHRLVRGAAAHCRLTAAVTSFGPTLEWFVAAVLEREYGIPSAWNVRLRAARAGGDYDVVGFQEATCVYIETKSSPPRQIEASQVRAFFDRLDALRPQLAVFLNDTQLRMQDKIVLLFTAELRRRLGRHARALSVQHLDGELFVIGDRVFIANSDPDLVANIGTCVAHYFRQQGVRLNEGP